MLALLLLPACGAATPEPTPSVEAEPLPEPTLTAEVVPTTAATVPAELDAAPTPADFAASGPASCTVTTMIPDPDPNIAALFAPITEDDWVVGPPDAVVTILEYSDFQ